MNKAQYIGKYEKNGKKYSLWQKGDWFELTLLSQKGYESIDEWHKGLKEVEANLQKKGYKKVIGEASDTSHLKTLGHHHVQIPVSSSKVYQLSDADFEKMMDAIPDDVSVWHRDEGNVYWFDFSADTYEDAVKAAKVITSKFPNSKAQYQVTRKGGPHRLSHSNWKPLKESKGGNDAKFIKDTVDNILSLPGAVGLATDVHDFMLGNKRVSMPLYIVIDDVLYRYAGYEGGKYFYDSRHGKKEFTRAEAEKARSVKIKNLQQDRKLYNYVMKESQDMNLISELLQLLEEKEPYGMRKTPGLDLGNFKLDASKKKILATIGNKKYEFTPKEGSGKSVYEIFNSTTGVAKHSPGRALSFLKKHAEGKLVESLEDPYVPTKGDTVKIGLMKGKIIDVDLPAPDEDKILIKLQSGKEVKVEGDKVRLVKESIEVLRKEPADIKDIESVLNKNLPDDLHLKFDEEKVDDGVEYTYTEKDPEDFHFIKTQLIKMGFKKTPWGYKLTDRWSMKVDERKRQFKILDEK